MSVTYEQDFPYEEIRQESGDYFDSWKQAKEAGFDDNQIWSICVHDDTYCIGPPGHVVNHLGHIATKEKHNMDTYYEETLSTD